MPCHTESTSATAGGAHDGRHGIRRQRPGRRGSTGKLPARLRPPGPPPWLRRHGDAARRRRRAQPPMPPAWTLRSANLQPGKPRTAPAALPYGPFRAAERPVRHPGAGRMAGQRARPHPQQRVRPLQRCAPWRGPHAIRRAGRGAGGPWRAGAACGHLLPKISLSSLSAWPHLSIM